MPRTLRAEIIRFNPDGSVLVRDLQDDTVSTITLVISSEGAEVDGHYVQLSVFKEKEEPH